MSEPAETLEEREEAQRISAEAALEDADLLLHRRRNAVLCTLSKRAEGWPFGSVVPFAVDREGRPIILIASIAEHTKNVIVDPRVSLLVQEAEGEEDVQARGRLTVMGRAEQVPKEDVEDAQARYLARLPDAAGYFDTHDFVFYRIVVDRLRYIGGFGKIFWLDPERYRRRISEDPILAGARRIIDHMNEDHADALALYCRGFRQIEPTSAVMTGVDRWGFDVKCDGPDHRLRFDFDEAATMATIRPIVVAMTVEARRRLGVER